MLDVILKGTWQTLYMVFFSTLIAVVLGFIPAVILTLTAEDGLKPNRIVYGILDVIVNVFRSFENALRETDAGVIEAAKSFGATDLQIITKVYFKESVPRLLNGIVLLIINMVGASAMAGTLGGGGLGDIAIRKGYQAYDISYLVVTSIVLIVIVQLVQGIGNVIYKKKA